MMTAVRYGLPAVLFVYFAWRSTRQRVFLLGIPFLMFQSRAVFLENIKLFSMPTRLGPAELMMIWLILVWLLYFDLFLPARRRLGGRRSQALGPALSLPEEIVLIGAAGLGALEFLLTVLRFGTVASALWQAKGFVYLFVGYVLLRSIFCHASRSDVIDLLTAIIVVNTVASLLFFLHQGLHLPVYVGLTEHQTVTFMGRELTRSFYFMPQLLAVALAFCFAKPRWGWFWTVVVLVNLAAVWVSYTRVLLVIALAELILVLGVRLLKSHQAGRALKRILALAAIAVVFGAAVFIALPAESRYFASRIGLTAQSGSIMGDENLALRFEFLRIVYKGIGAESYLVGQGFAAPHQEPMARDLYRMSADTVWVPILYRFGLAGVAVVGLLYGLFILRALRMGVSGTGEAEFLALVLLGALAGQFLGGMTSWTILDPVRYPLGLWLFALLAAESYWRRGEQHAPTVPAGVSGQARA